MSDFYVFVPSNVDDARVNDTNTQSNFRVNLTETLKLEGNWEVGLKEILIPKYWYNISPPDNVITVSACPSVRRLGDPEPSNGRTSMYVMDLEGYVYNSKEVPAHVLQPLHHQPTAEDLASRKRIGDIVVTREIVIPAGRYTPETFMKTFNKLLKEIPIADRPLFYRIKGYYDEPSRCITFQLGPGDSIHVTSLKLAQMLGFAETEEIPQVLRVSRSIPELIPRLNRLLELNRHSVSLHWNAKRKRRIQLPRPALFNRYNAHMYVYCSIVKHSQVGNIFAPILRVVNTDDTNETRENIHQNYWIAQYHEMRYNLVKHIDIEIYDSYGDTPVFSRGNVLAVLHFRPRQ